MIELMLLSKALNITDKIQVTGKWKANRKEREQDQMDISLWEFLTVVCCVFEHKKMGSSHSPALIQRDMGILCKSRDYVDLLLTLTPCNVHCFFAISVSL